MNFLERVNKIFQDKFASNGNVVDLEYRKKHLEEFNKVGLPTLKHEEWKYTNLTFLNELDFDLINSCQEFDIDELLKRIDFLNGSDSIVLPFVNGKMYETIGGSGNSVLVERIDEQSIFSPNSSFSRFLKFYDNSNPFGYLNLALFTDSLGLKIAKNTNLELPIVFLFYYNSEFQGIANSFSLIEVGENSNLNIIVLFANNSDKKIFANEIINLHLGKNSNVEINYVQCDIRNLSLINTLNVIAERETNFKANTFSLNTEFVRNNLNLDFADEHSSAFLNGIYIVGDGDFVDDHTLVMHNRPNCTSDESFRGILDGTGRAVFNGKIFVARNAQKTNAYQSNKNLLLSNEARVNTKPQLEIYADDVKCTHGATAGFLDQEMLFYIISRGISKDKAKSLLLNSFVSENLEKVEQPDLRNFLKELVAKKLRLEDIFFCSSIDELTKVSS